MPSPIGSNARVRGDSPPSVVVVVVAYNRAELLVRALDGISAQTRPADAVVVIDNASSDDSAHRAGEHPVVTEVVTLPVNTGGAGGFAAGIARAVTQHRADLVWVMDDDTVPRSDALGALLVAREAYPGTPVLLASRADWHDGREHPMNTPRTRVFLAPALRRHAREVGTRQIRTASFVSILIDSRSVRERGLPLASYFLWNDDFEYTARLLRGRVGLYVPASRVVHLTKAFGASDADPGPRFFNEVRNKVWVFARSEAFGPVERALYVGSTLVRWVRTVARGGNRPALLRSMGDGLRAGLKSPPSTADILRGTVVEADVLALEGRHG